MKTNLATVPLFLATALGAMACETTAFGASAQQTGAVPAPAPAPPRAQAAPSTADSRIDAGRPAVTVVPGAQTVAPSRSGRATVSRPQQAALMLELEAGREGGRIAVAIYRDADSFRKGEQPVRTLMVDRDGAITRAWVLGLTPGRYAIAAFHDTDGDGQLTKWPFGLPREPFGFSNNARARTGPPAFDSAAFDLPANGATQRIRLREPLNAILR